MVSFGSSMKKIDCQDGPRYFLKNPEKAFTVHFADFDIKLNSLIKMFSTNVSLNQEVNQKNITIVKNLTERYASLQTYYLGAYLGWYGNPCSKEAEERYHIAKDLICARELELAEIENMSQLIAKDRRPLAGAAKTAYGIENIEKQARKIKGRKRESVESLPQAFQEKQESVILEVNEHTIERLDKIQELISKLEV